MSAGRFLTALALFILSMVVLGFYLGRWSAGVVTSIDGAAVLAIVLLCASVSVGCSGRKQVRP